MRFGDSGAADFAFVCCSALIQAVHRRNSGEARSMTDNESPTWLPAAWRTSAGGVVACVEKLKVMNGNLDEIRGLCQDALEDGILMGCDEQQIRAVLHALIDSL